MRIPHSCFKLLWVLLSFLQGFFFVAKSKNRMQRYEGLLGLEKHLIHSDQSHSQTLKLITFIILLLK